MENDAEKFHGFSLTSLEFLRDLKTNNSKAWFEAHRSAYEQHLLSPLRALTAGLTPLMLAIDPDLVVEPRRVISRIHRDTRFSRDKSPYKSTLWLAFKRPLSEWQDAPAFFFELGVDTWRYGMGFYAASKETMDRLRRLIEQKPAEFERMVAFLADQDRFVVEGEQYKRVINPVVPEHLRPWHQSKSVYLVCNRQSGNQLYERELLQELITGFSLLEPLYHSFSKLRIAGC
ncbi:MAG TPA: DUF2461 domain-containing protein [Desulfuromonadaceae bacterium]|jgi:uncharacterized protein (TIGR02453 family)